MKGVLERKAPKQATDDINSHYQSSLSLCRMHQRPS